MQKRYDKKRFNIINIRNGINRFFTSLFQLNRGESTITNIIGNIVILNTKLKYCTSTDMFCFSNTPDIKGYRVPNSMDITMHKINILFKFITFVFEKKLY